MLRRSVRPILDPAFSVQLVITNLTFCAHHDRLPQPEPPVHFVLLAAALFGASALLGPGDNLIEITRDDLEWRILQVEAEEGRSLTGEERALVRERYIDEQVLVREALALGLEEDERIDDILVQKMLHVLSGDVIQPTDEELAAYYQMNIERYAVQETVTIDEVVAPVGAALPSALLEGGEPEDLGDGALTASRVMSRMTIDDLVLIFGDVSAPIWQARTWWRS